MRQPGKLAIWAAILLLCAASGVFFSLAIMRQGHPMIGAVFGLFTGVPMLAFMRGSFLPGLQERLRRLAFPLYAPASLAIYVLMIVVSSAVAGGLLWTSGLWTLLHNSGSLLDAIVVSPADIIYSLSILAIILFMLRVKDLIGGEVFLSLLTGRYHRPKPEERIFLFIDVVGSTQFAERFGDLRTQEYLGRFFASLAKPVRRYRGSIDDYVGDLAIVTWPLQRGVDEARCVSCVFALLRQIQKEAQFWQSRFGTVPRFRAALHGGSVVAAEIGVDRHKIAYFGDTVNTTARLETLCRDLDEPILISAELLSRITALPADVRATNLGSHALRGRDQKLAIAALASVSNRLAAPARVAA
jgi:adenylate cyclase